MATTRKKVILRRLDQTLIPGYLPPSAFVSQTPSGPVLDLLDLEGRILPVPLAEVRHVAYVRDFNRDDATNPERLTRTAFLSRPRAEGLWLRITFAAGDQIEGLAPLDTTLLDALVDDAGLFLTPPSVSGLNDDARTNTHRLFIPRAAIASLQLLAVVTTPSRTPKPAKAADPQPLLFPEVR
jgi:hypothetical protein